MKVGSTGPSNKGEGLGTVAWGVSTEGVRETDWMALMISIPFCSHPFL